MKIWDKSKNEYYEEIEYGKRKLEFLYNTIIGRLLLKIIFSSRWFSRLQALYQKSSISKYKIKKFIDRYKIDMKRYKDVSEYKNFSDFFTRKRNIINNSNSNELVSVSDSKVQVFIINSNLMLNIKNSMYSVKEIIDDDKIVEEFKDGICIVYRLSVDDYHRYMYLDDGTLTNYKKIKGKLHTIRPISYKYNSFVKNTREVSIMNTNNFGKVIQIEIGAMLVGKIVNNYNKEFKKLEEKGFFDYGGSTIVQLFKKDVIKIDEEIIENSKNDIETRVEIGMKIGEKIYD